MGPSAPTALEVRVLGPVEVCAAGEPLAVDRPMERGLAARLALARGSAVADDTLARDLWDDDPDPARVGERLRVLTHRLRRALGEHAPALRRTPAGYALAAVPIDLDEVEAATRTARRTEDPAAAHSAALDALARWRGPALGDVRATPFGATEGVRLDGLQISLHVQRLELELALGHDITTDAEHLAAEHPLDEHLVGLLAVALYRAGRQADALGRLTALRTTLADQLGVDPSPDTAELELRLLRQDPALLAPAGRAPAAARGLPALRWLASSDPFVGRDAEATALRDDLATPSLITLTGGPGVGKTRLAREVAAATHAAGRPTAWLDLVTATSTDVTGALATAARVEPGAGDPLPLCAERLTGALLVIDNAEHVIDEVAELLGPLVRATEGLSVLVTSQRPIRISGEVIHPVAPLDPDAAVELFRARSGLAADDRIALVCAAADRLPLAIELAAGLTRTLTLDQLVQRIEHRLRLLVTGNRDTGTRHGSLRSALDWSHSLLDPPAQQVLRRLAVFAGGCTLEAAERVTSGAGIDAVDVAAILADLHDRCLVTTGTGAARYRLLETVRDYALEQLRASGEEDSVRRAHAGWCTDLAARTQRYGGPDHDELARELSEEEGNLRAAIAWALSDDGDPAQVLAIVAPTWWY
jgi:predicted ATPase/DNA-binding SARP family transcriptional activator